MIIARPRKSDAVLVFIGLVIFVLLILGVFLVVRKQPEVPKQAPGAPGAAALRAFLPMFDSAHLNPASAQSCCIDIREPI